MKNHIHLAIVRLLSATLCSITISALAAVPVRWTAETSRVQPIALDAWRGDTLALECTLKSYGQPVTLGASTASIMWQTNGMGSAWWQTNATVSADGVIRATWSPSMDPGAPAVAFFLPVQTGDGTSYRAAGTLRFRPSPGADAQIAELPQPGATLDFGVFNLVNAPWATLAAANEAISASVTSATGALVIPPPVDLTPYATTCYVDGAITSATGALVIPPPVDLTPYATADSVALAVQTASNTLSNDIKTAFNYASNRTDLVKANLLEAITSSTNNLRSALINNISESASETRAYADSVASNAQRSAIAAIPSLSGYATEQYVSEAIGGITIPSMSGYATTAYADAAASNAQAAAIAAIPNLAGYATEQYAQNAASAAASDALSAAQAYARDLSWAASEGNTRLVSLDGTIWQDATGTVWQISYVYGWAGTVIDLPTTTTRAIRFYPVPDSPNTWTAGGGTNLMWDSMSWILDITNSLTYADMGPTLSATNLTFETTVEKYYLYYSIVSLVTNPVDHVLYASASGDAATADRSLSIGTPTRWTDATGCVWEVGYRYDNDWVADSSRVTEVYWISAGNEDDPDLWSVDFMVDGSTQVTVYSRSPGPTQTNLSISASDWVTQYDGAFDFNIYRSPHTTTNLVGRVALTNDLPGAIISTISDFASTGTVHAAESSTYSLRLFDASYDSAYDATYLIRESTNAATAVSSSIVRYALVTPGEWSFSGAVSDITYSVKWDGDNSRWSLFDSTEAEVAYANGTQSDLQVSFQYEVEGEFVTVTATRASLPGHLCDRAVSAVSLSSPTNITLPALAHPGQARDFILLLDIPSSVTNTVPAITNLLTFTASGSETVHFYVDGDDPSTATFPLPTSPGTWSYSFSEFKASWFAVSLKPIVEASAPGGAQ